VRVIAPRLVFGALQFEPYPRASNPEILDEFRRTGKQRGVQCRTMTPIADYVVGCANVRLIKRNFY
jgi:hypothetical protein